MSPSELALAPVSVLHTRVAIYTYVVSLSIDPEYIPGRRRFTTIDSRDVNGAPGQIRLSASRQSEPFVLATALDEYAERRLRAVTLRAASSRREHFLAIGRLRRSLVMDWNSVRDQAEEPRICVRA